MTSEHKKQQALKIASAMLAEHGLAHWRLEVTRATTYHAETDHGVHVLRLSSNMIKVATKEQFIGVVTHEIVHMMLGPGYGHGDIFTSAYHATTGNYEYATQETLITIRRYLASCKHHGIVGCTNTTKEFICELCANENQETVLDLTINPLKEIKW